MHFKIIQGRTVQQSTPCLSIFVDYETQTSTYNAVNRHCNGQLKIITDRGDLGSKPGDTLLIPTPWLPDIERILLVSPGTEPLTQDTAVKAMDGMVNALQKAKVSGSVICTAELAATDDINWSCQYLIQTLVASSYRFTQCKKTDDDSLCKLENVHLLDNDAYLAQAAVDKGMATGNGINVARELGNLPGNICTPTYLAAQAEAMAKKHRHLSTQSLGEKAMEKLGMGSFLSVAKGSSEEGRLIIMEYKGGKRDEAPRVLLGKGVTFDSGGISLKPGAAMDEMKFDMCGAAAVMGTMAALIELEPAINVTGVIASTENMPAGNASKPGDVVTSMSGKTIEILNTDAEGRLILCDALTYIERFKPQAVIDIATLTGACVSALGHHTSGMISNNDELAAELQAMSNTVKDPVWRLPAGELYEKQLRSNFADLANIGGAAAGTITAGCFLAKFAEAYPWAHLDIAGTAWKKGENKGATGRPVALLLHYLLSKEESA